MDCLVRKLSLVQLSLRFDTDIANYCLGDCRDLVCEWFKKGEDKRQWLKLSQDKTQVGARKKSMF